MVDTYARTVVGPNMRNQNARNQNDILHFMQNVFFVKILCTVHHCIHFTGLIVDGCSEQKKKMKQRKNVGL